MMGTPQFMPPEQARGEWTAVDGRTDLWTLGATMYACVSGKAVREAATPNLALLAAMTEPVRRVREVAPWVPVAVAEVIDRALSLDRAKRFASAEEMKRAIEAALHDTSSLADAPSEAARADAPGPPSLLSRRVGFVPERSWKPRWTVAVAVVGFAGASAAVVAVREHDDSNGRVEWRSPTPSTSLQALPGEPVRPSATLAVAAPAAEPAAPRESPSSTRTPPRRPSITKAPAARSAVPLAAPPPPVATPPPADVDPLDVRH